LATDLDSRQARDLVRIPASTDALRESVEKTKKIFTMGKPDDRKNLVSRFDCQGTESVVVRLRGFLERLITLAARPGIVVNLFEIGRNCWNSQ
jgi:hypothetical protein